MKLIYRKASPLLFFLLGLNLFLIVDIVDLHYLSCKVEAILFVIDSASKYFFCSWQVSSRGVCTCKLLWRSRSFLLRLCNEYLLVLILAFSVYNAMVAKFYLGRGFFATGLSYFLTLRELILICRSLLDASLAASVRSKPIIFTTLFIQPFLSINYVSLPFLLRKAAGFSTLF